jgi:hypothetical protein
MDKEYCVTSTKLSTYGDSEQHCDLTRTDYIDVISSTLLSAADLSF